jgi:hypothetical protein
VHVNNWLGIKDLADFITENNYSWDTNVLTYPKKLDIINLSLEEKTNFANMLLDIQVPNKEYMLNHIQYESR